MRVQMIAVVGVVLLGAGACTGKKPEAGGAAATVAAAPMAPPEVHFTAKDFAFEGPDTIQSGMTTIVLHNDGPSLHHLTLMRLDSGKTVADLKAAFDEEKTPLDDPVSWAVLSGGVNPPMPGSDTQATLMIKPGNYAIVCLVDVPDHVMHVMNGMIKGLTVVPSKTPSAPAPTADLTVTEVDFAFAPSAPFTAGHHVIKVVNSGSQAHEFELVKLNPGKTMKDLAAWGETYKGPLPGISLGGAAPMMPGDVEYVPVDLTPGNYAALCFVVDPASHMPHIAKGMVLPFTIS
jgi:hypothetical protein